ncbi:class I SAM-dependent methyltransferase [Paenibacillus alba]|uniref:Class I SAM-dependent methyltransferase n=1 Tax=Paenibacillus alba TaxID=1197127 RepID=A0ABU6G1E1_9BACL|nr:class I SAM-dependent methyltransferase [Paenibacillus alba]MEC0227962.1 class I SAM-dependent methyltransferase [Paenibacillus alba]
MIVSTELCYVCGKTSNFSIIDNATLLREAKCQYCNASIRNSDTAKIIMKFAIGRELPLAEGIDIIIESQISILESQASGPIHDILMKSPNYFCFEYFQDVKTGEYISGIMSNNLEQLTFKDDSFDIVISQDVLEHVLNPDKAFIEINRVLKRNGHHVFTVPLHEDRKTKSRINSRPIYHGDPLSEHGSLVITDWGSDITEIVDTYGMKTEQFKVHSFYKPSEITNVDSSYSAYLTLEPLQYYCYNSIVFPSKKLFDYQSDLLLTSNDELRLLNYGPDSIMEGIKFNEQPNGESAIWAHAENANKTVIIKLDDIELESNCNDQGTLVTAIVPSWLYRFERTFSLYLYDTLTKKNSNSLPFTVKPLISQNIEGHSINNSLKALQQDNFNLSKELHKLRNKRKPKFDGWEMTTNQEFPWLDKFNWENFRKTSTDIKKVFNFGLNEDIGIDVANVDTLLWRHWIVVFTLKYALEFTAESQESLNLVECGVGDGMSAFFVLREMEHFKLVNPNIKYKMHLYDSWDSIRNEDLTESELFLEGRYKNNSLERVKSNLCDFEEYLMYHVGYIPEILKNRLPTISYLHIDLNSTNSTLAALQFFYPSLDNGSMILFDDYGWMGFNETKETIDQFFSDKPGVLLKFPTGQAIYFYK